MKKLILFHSPFPHQHPITPLPILTPYPPCLPPRPDHSPHSADYQTLRHGSDPVTIHGLVAIQLIALDPDMAEGDVFLREGVRRFGDDGVAFECYNALDGEPFGVRRGPVVAFISMSLSTLSSFSVSPPPPQIIPKAFVKRVDRRTDKQQPCPSSTPPPPSTCSPTPDRSPGCCCNPYSRTEPWMARSRS